MQSATSFSQRQQQHQLVAAQIPGPALTKPDSQSVTSCAYECRFDVCDGGKVAEAYLECHATPAVPGRIKTAETVSQAAGEHESTEHADKVYILAAHFSHANAY